MRCSGCSTENPDQANFCFHCGNPFSEDLSFITPSEHLPPGTDDKISSAVRRLMPDQFVRKLMASRGRVEGERRIVTILFSDVKGSTAMAERLDPEEVMDIMNGAFEKMIAPITKYEGTLARLMGDAILAFFGAPVAHEDDPERACRAALEILEGVGGYAKTLERKRGISGFNVRIGINTGLVVVGEVGTDLRVEYTAMGDAVNLAARMESTAEPGTIRITETTHRIVREKFETVPLGGLDIKGKAKPVGVFRLTGIRRKPATESAPAVLRSSLVGRKKELDLLRKSLYDLDEGKPSIVLISGEAGVGKTRLVADGRESAPGTIGWVKGRAVPYSTGTSYWMIKNFLCSLIGVSADASTEVLGTFLQKVLKDQSNRNRGDVPSVGGTEAPDDTYAFLSWLLNVPVDGETEKRIRGLDGETFKARLRDAVRGVIERRSAGQPMVVSWEDLHWADPSSLGLLEAILPAVREMPVSFLLTFRPESGGVMLLRERTRSVFGPLCTTIDLRPLKKSESRVLLDNFLGKSVLPPKLSGEILEKTEGNPFYLEEVLRSMIDSGAVRRGKDGKFSGTVTGGFSIPETLQGVITARLDCLAPGYRRILQVSSVVGRNFRKNIVASVLDTPVEDKSLADSIAELSRRDFIYPRAALRADLGPGGDTEFSFKHGITQDVVYGSLLLAQRRTMHQRVGESFERNYPGKTDEFAATLAMHFEKAGEREKALTYTMKAAEIARSTYANQEALLHLLKALSFLEENGEDEPGGRSRAGVYESLGDIYGVIAKYESAISSFDSALSLVTGNHSRAVLLRKKGQVYERWGRYEPADACFRKALDELKEVDDATEEARVRIGLGRVFLRLEKLDDAAGHCEEALSVMDRVNDTSGAAEACNTLGNIYSKKREFEKAVDCYERCRGIWEEAGHLDGLAVIYNNLGQIFHHREKWNEAALHYEKSLDLSEKIGNRYGSARTSDNLSQVYATLGDQKRAMKYLKKAVDIFGEISREGADVIPEMWTQSGSL